jgi:hypothetical protein
MGDLPKERAMAQLSRPYQIALVGLAFLVLVWFVALRGHSASPGSTPAASTPAPTAASKAKGAAAPAPVYHGAAPGVEGLTRAIAKAHGAVTTSQQNAKQLQEKSAQASAPTSTAPSSSTSTTGSQPTSSTPATPASSATTSKSAARTAVKPHKATASGTPAQQKAVESELKGGKVVLLLFWNPKASVDVAVHKELQAVGRKLRGKIAVHDALAKQVGSFGSITKAIQVYQTPTILLVNRHGVTTTLTGLTDVYSLEQTIEEARHA